MWRARLCKDNEARKAIVALRDKLLKKYEADLPPSLPDELATENDVLCPADLEEFLEQREGQKAVISSDRVDMPEASLSRGRDEGRALEAAAKDLARLKRYERRAASRMQRAILAFVGLKGKISIEAVDHP